MRITYNSPVILTYTFLAILVMFFAGNFNAGVRSLFTVGASMDFTNPLDYFRLFSHVVGHINWQHLIGNFTFILLLGPILEEKYGSSQLLIMIFITGLVTGILNVLVFPTALLGASGIVFMLILLSSMVNFKKKTIPLTFILIATLYLGREFVNMYRDDQISQSAHIIGGICGAAFGFYFVKK
ncbi:MAG TPA: rhomboid family intramembrane serine protease [Cyclobacteriaceae bacterium]